MARTVTDRELASPSGLRASYGCATQADEAAIRRLLRENPMPGAVSLTFEREPHYFRGADVAFAQDQSIVAWSEGRLVCMGRCSRRTCWVDGRAARVAYLAELRLDAAARGQFALVRDGYRYFHDLRPDGDAELCFTSIGSDNERARRLLERGARGMPIYSYLSDLVTLLIAVPRSPRKPNFHIEPATTDRIPEMLGLLNGQGRGHQLAAVWTEESLRDLERHGLPLSRFFLIMDGDGLLACGALWDQRCFRQTVIRGYGPLLSMARPWVNLAGRVLNTTRLPLPGRPLAHAFLSPLAFAPDATMLMSDFVEALFPVAAALGLEFLTLGLPATDVRLTGLQRRFSSRPWRSRLYRVDWPEQAPFEMAARGLEILPDVALL